MAGVVRAEIRRQIELSFQSLDPQPNRISRPWPAAAVQELWGLLAPYWGRPREIRSAQPVMAISTEPLVPPDPLVRLVRPDEIDTRLPASVAMCTEEVGVSPIGPDGGAAYRARVAELIRAGRSYARIEDGSLTSVLSP